MSFLLRLLEIALVLGLVSCQLRPGWQPNSLGEANLKHAAFIGLFESKNTDLAYEDRWKLFVSTFDAAKLGEFDDVFYMNSPGRFLDSVATWENSNLVDYDKSAYWPNDMYYTPSDVVGVEGIIQTSGFLVPTKKDGQLQIYDTTVDPPLFIGNIADGDSNEWSHHRVHWQDMDLDGDLDAVTARFNLPNVGDVKHEFMWFENPGNGISSGWRERVISETGPDIHFAKVSLTAATRTYDVFIFAEFFNERITLYWTENENNDWSDLSMVNSRSINDNAGQTFDVFVDDFNRDGNLEFIASEYNVTNGTGHAKVYFFPNDFRTDDFASTIIADNFIPYAIDKQHMTPGSPKTYYPSKAYEEELAEDGMQHKPWILLSGDDDGKMYILYPSTEDRSDWSYDKHILVDTLENTCGTMAHADLDNDGYQEIVVAGYSSGKLYVFSYAPTEL